MMLLCVSLYEVVCVSVLIASAVHCLLSFFHCVCFFFFYNAEGVIRCVSGVQACALAILLGC